MSDASGATPVVVLDIYGADAEAITCQQCGPEDVSRADVHGRLVRASACGYTEAVQEVARP